MKCEMKIACKRFLYFINTSIDPIRKNKSCFFPRDLIGFDFHDTRMTIISANRNEWIVNSTAANSEWSSSMKFPNWFDWSNNNSISTSGEHRSYEKLKKKYLLSFYCKEKFQTQRYFIFIDCSFFINYNAL